MGPENYLHPSAQGMYELGQANAIQMYITPCDAENL
jgi:hypothetical protein